MENSVLSFFEHNMMLFYVIPLLYVLKLIGFSPKGRPKMRQFFLLFVHLKYTNLFSCQLSPKYL